MASLDSDVLVVIALAFLGGGIVKGVLGIGLPLVVVPVIATATDPLFAIIMMLVPAVTSNVMQARQAGFSWTGFRRFWPAAIGVAAGAIAGSTFLSLAEPETARIVLAVVVVLFCATQFLGRLPPVPTIHERWVTPVLGASSGIAGGLTGFFGLALVPYLVSLRLPKELFVATIGMLYLCGVGALYGALALGGAYTWQMVGVSALCALPTLAGVWLGSRIRRKVDEALFRKLLVAALVLIALNLLRTSMMS
jgi:uncharacterized membrane protein YfcA